MYEVQDPGAVTDSGQQTEQVTVTVEPGPISAYGGPLLLLVGLAGAGVLGGVRYRGDLAVSDRERDRFVVFEGDRTYTYSPPDSPEGDRPAPAGGQGDSERTPPGEEAETADS